jgi:uncharacterized membrane protein
MANCAKCGAALGPGATFCGSCGTPVGAAAAPAGAGQGAAATAAAPATSGGLAQNVAGMLAYFTIIGAILMMVLEPYNKDKFVRFHAFQSLFLNIAWIVLWIATWIVMMVPVLGWIIGVLAWLVLGLGGLILWIVLVFKAYGNQKFMLPVIGKMAEEQASK